MYRTLDDSDILRHFDSFAHWEFQVTRNVYWLRVWQIWRWHYFRLCWTAPELFTVEDSQCGPHVFQIGSPSHRWFLEAVCFPNEVIPMDHLQSPWLGPRGIPSGIPAFAEDGSEVRIMCRFGIQPCGSELHSWRDDVWPWQPHAEAKDCSAEAALEWPGHICPNQQWFGRVPPWFLTSPSASLAWM